MSGYRSTEIGRFKLGVFGDRAVHLLYFAENNTSPQQILSSDGALDDLRAILISDLSDEIDRLRVIAQHAVENGWEEWQERASNLRVALFEALDNWEGWVTSEGDIDNPDHARIAELRKVADE